MADLDDERLREIAATPWSRVDAAPIAAELLAAREALRAADALAEAAIDVAGIGPGVYMATCRLCDARATGPAGVEVDHSDGCPLPAYLHHAARGAR